MRKKNLFNQRITEEDIDMMLENAEMGLMTLSQLGQKSLKNKI